MVWAATPGRDGTVVWKLDMNLSASGAVAAELRRSIKQLSAGC